MFWPVRYFKAPWEENIIYKVDFRSWKRHGTDHIENHPEEDWPRLLKTQTPTPRQYLDFTFRAVKECFVLPRYLKCVDANAQHPEGMPKMMAAHSSGVLIVGFRHFTYMGVMTAHRMGEAHFNDHQRLAAVKARIC